MHTHRNLNRKFSQSPLHQALAAALLGLTLSGPGLAQGTSPVQAAVQSFDIQPGPLGRSLATFATRAGVALSFDPAIAKGLQSPGLQGTHTTSEALARLLAGSGLEAVLRADGSYGLERQARAEANTLRAAEQSSNDATLLETLVVLGEKFPRSQFNTFTSVEVVTAEKLDDYVWQSLDEALNSSANIRMFENSGNTNIAIRGLTAEGPTQPSRSSPLISVSVDGAEQSIEATRRGTRGVWDVEQIEVLRGPQSTLQGRNALAGALVIKTKDPTFAPETIVRGGGDTGDNYSGAFAVSGPIDEQLAFRFAGQVARGDKGISYSDPNWASNGDEEFEEFRGKLLFTPSKLPGFTGLFSISRTHDKPAYNAVSGPDFFARKYTTGGFEEFRDTVVNRYTADLKYEFTPDWTIQSVTSYVDTKMEIDAPRSATYFRDDTRDREDFSQDIRLTYGSKKSVFSGVLGLYAGQFSGKSVSDSEMDVFGLGYTIPLQRLNSKNKSTSLAVYADGRYKFMDRWTVLAGGRLLHDKVSYNVKGVVLAGTFDASLDEVSSVSNTEFLPKIGLAFELSENQNFAVTASKGYRPGFSELIIGTTTITNVKPESLWAYELAYRSRWLNDRLRINSNVFYYDYTNMQVPVPVPGFLGNGWDYSVNAGRAHSYGAEFEARWNFDSGLEMFAGLGLLKTRFDAGEYQGVNLAGNKFPEAPSLTASLGGNYKHQSGWFVGGDVSFTDGYYSKGEVRNRRSGGVDSFTVVNAQAGYDTGEFTFTAYAKNLLNEKYLTSISSNGTSASIGDARTVGLQVTARF